MDPQVDLTVEQRDRLVSAGEALFPQHATFPSFREADPTGEVLDAALVELRRDLPRIIELLDSAGDRGVDAWLADLRGENPSGFETLRVLLAGSYLSCRPVWRALNYPGRVDNPVADGEEVAWLTVDGEADGLLAAVRKRGPVYRPTPAQ